VFVQKFVTCQWCFSVSGDHEVIFLLKTFFFAYLVLLIRFENPMSPLLILGAVLVIYAGRAVIAWRVLKGTTPGLEETFQMSVIAPKGLAAAVLASIPAERGLPGGEVLVSIMLTALLIPAMRNARVESVCRRW